MRYISFLKNITKKHTCPFCHEKEEHMLEIGRYFYVIPSRSPYSKHHLLIVPKRHANLLGTLTDKELKEMHILIDKRTKILHKKHKDVSLLLRDGLVKDKVINKSINHLHFHLLPDIGISLISKTKGEKKEFIDETAFTRMVKAYKKTFEN